MLYIIIIYFLNIHEKVPKFLISIKLQTQQIKIYHACCLSPSNGMNS